MLSLVDAAEGWQREIADLQTRAEEAETGLDSSLSLRVLFRGPGNLPRTRVLAFESRSLCVEVTLPPGIVRDREKQLLTYLQDAVDAADTYAQARGRADDLWAVWQVFIRLCSNNTPYQRWMDAYNLAHHRPTSLPTLSCPNCGAHNLRLEFEVKDPCATYGTAYFWCNTCLTGPMPTPAPLPPQATTTPWGTLNPPNYTIVPE
ncbi:hypothetical protein [Kribbella sp. NPDC051620]|uniref:hypothetical protein n=1 Tax=Kribbella sp. NPDC051620 TaxID=3364120 RepID=UPI0037B18BEA